MKIKRHHKTKIVATVGPACSDIRTLILMAEKGVNVFRLNFSHGSHEDHLKVIEHIQAINEKYDWNLALLADLQGPKIRVGTLNADFIELKKNDELLFTTNKNHSNHDSIYISYQSFAKDVKQGDRILVDDGKLVLEVVSSNDKDEVKLKIVFGGKLYPKKGVNLPDTKLSQPSLTEKDLIDLEFILKHPVNWVALSFVRKAEDIISLKEKIKETRADIKVIAKIEKPEALVELEDIVIATDAVMVARGDLGVEVPMEQIPLIQKDIVNKCIEYSKPVIIATQMMESMITNPSPSRAEVTDVANAVLDGADAVMLSGETSVGVHPPLVIEAMAKIIAQIEDSEGIYYKGEGPNLEGKDYLANAISFNASKISRDIEAEAIIGMTKSGYTAFQLSSYRPKSNIFIFTDSKPLLNTLSLVWGVRGFYYNKFVSTDETIEDVQEILKAKGLLEENDIIINLGSMPLHSKGMTNMLKISVVN